MIEYKKFYGGSQKGDTMASWITHLIIADEILKRIPNVDRRGFCVGSIAPDCNVENEDWTEFVPPKSVTHWMTGPRKRLSDADRFCRECIEKRWGEIRTGEEYAFLLGYYAHLLTDAAYELMARNEDRVRAAWTRIRQNEALNRASVGMEETWDSIKTLITRREIKRSTQWYEAEYLRDHPDSGYLTELLPLKVFPSYLDYQEPGCIVRKIGVMGHVPEMRGSEPDWIAISREEYAAYIADTVELIVMRFIESKYINEVTKEEQNKGEKSEKRC